jgi:glycosyltransferase involved in cell wall biosynthesis
MKTAVIHDWLVTYAGAERALEQIVALYPDCDLYSLVDFLPQDQRGFILNKKANTSFIQRLPFAKKKYRSYLPFMPVAIEQFDLSGYDLVISSSYAVAKGVLTHARQVHVCYCYTPMRYAWDLHHQYLRESGLQDGLRGAAARLFLHYIRMWDFTTANRPDHFVAISRYIADRIKKIYGKCAPVVYPPVDIDTFSLHDKTEDYYLTASRLVPYKRVDLIVEAFSRMPGKRLMVIGDGPDFKKVKAKSGKNVEMLGYQPPEIMKEYMQKAKAFVYAAEEDFGIVTVEAQACGTPVIAFGEGGSRETVIPIRAVEAGQGKREESPTGIFFDEQTPESLVNAVLLFERNQDQFNRRVIRENAVRFSAERFRREFKGFIDNAMEPRST